MNIKGNNQFAARILGVSASRRLSFWLDAYKSALARTTPYIPLGESYQKLVRKEIINCLKANLKKFDQLPSIEDKTKTQLRGLFRSQLKEVASFEGSKKIYLTSAAMCLYFFAFLLPAVLIPFWAPFVLKLVVPPFIVWLYVIPGYLISGYIFTYAYRLLVFVNKKINTTAYFMGFMLLLLLQGALIYYITTINSDVLAFLLVTPFLVNEIALLIYIFSLIVIVLWFGFWSAKRIQRLPTAYISYEHLSALNLIATTAEQNRQNIDSRKKAAEHLLSAARYCSPYLRKSLMTKDADINNWAGILVDNIAAGVRSIAKKILISTNTSDLQLQITKNFVAILTANFADCATEESGKLSALEKKKILRSKLTTLIIGIIPPLLLYILQTLDLMTNFKILDYAFLASWIWLIANLILIVDPAISERIKLFKDIVGLLPMK